LERTQKERGLKDLKKKMVFLTGPRQVGKTWLAKDIATHFPKSVYLPANPSLPLKKNTVSQAPRLFCT